MIKGNLKIFDKNTWFKLSCDKVNRGNDTNEMIGTVDILFDQNEKRTHLKCGNWSQQRKKHKNSKG